MKKISVKNLVEFRRKSDKAKSTFIKNIMSNKVETPSEGGGDYWVTSLSAVCKSYKDGDFEAVESKIEELQDKAGNTSYTRTKNMYQRNVTILQKYKSIDLNKLRPAEKLSFLKKSKVNHLLTIKGLQIEAKPSHVYTFGNKNEEKIGAVWFVAKLNGYRSEELGMFCEMLFRFLKHNYLKKYQIISEYCVAVDLLNGTMVEYSKIEDGTLNPILNMTLDEINKLIRN